MNSILQDIYYGLLNAFNHRAEPETHDIRQKIRSERRYFASILSPEDFERFKNLEALHGESHTIRYTNTFIRAFNIGVMMTVMKDSKN